MPRPPMPSAWRAQIHGAVRPMERPAGEPSLLQGTALLAAILAGMFAAVMVVAAVWGG